MPLSPFSRQMVPAEISAIAAFAPPIAALIGRRSIREPAGAIAVGWGALAALGVISFLRYYELGVPKNFSTRVVGTGLLVAMFLPPTLLWIGPRAARLRWPAFALSLLLAAVLVATLGMGRELAAFGDPIVGAILCIVTGLAYAARVRTAPVSLREHDWFWILTGQFVYFAVQMFRGPIQESLVAHHWDLGIPFSSGVMLVFTAAYLMIARGMLLSPARASRGRGTLSSPRLSDSTAA